VDPDATNNAVSYSLLSNPGDLFAIDAVTGVVTVASAIDREVVGPSVDITVLATSADGSTSSQSFTIAINELLQTVLHYVGTTGDDLMDFGSSLESVYVQSRAGNDTVIGSVFADTIYGAEGHDSIVGNGGDDNLFGGAGNDTLIAVGGAPLIEGGDGDDAIFIDAAALLLPATDILGGAGFDSVTISAGPSLSLSDILGSMSQVELIDFSAPGVSADLRAFNHAAATSLLGASGPGLNLALRLDGDDLFSIDDPVGDGFSFAQVGNIYTFYNSEILQDATTEIAKVSLI
jgi:Ca2+-binding RTX toxin-like protein